jgi:hypothetical protein
MGITVHGIVVDTTPNFPPVIVGDVGVKVVIRVCFFIRRSVVVIKLNIFPHAVEGALLPRVVPIDIESRDIFFMTFESDVLRHKFGFVNREPCPTRPLLPRARYARRRVRR